MTQTAAKYARVLWELKIPEDAIEETLRIYRSEPELKRVLESPAVYIEEKHAVVEKVFPKEMQGFLKICCDYCNMEYLEETIEAYRVYANEHNHILNAQLRYVTPPDEKQIEGIREFLLDRYHADGVDLKMIRDESLIGGFILSADGQEYDWSLSGRISEMKEQLNRR